VTAAVHLLRLARNPRLRGAGTRPRSRAAGARETR
jgi:hypothetical protein